MLKELYEILEYENRFMKRLSDFRKAQKEVEYQRMITFWDRVDSETRATEDKEVVDEPLPEGHADECGGCATCEE